MYEFFVIIWTVTQFCRKFILLLVLTLLQVPDTDLILIIATLEDFQISRLLVDGLGGTERYHRLDLWNELSLFCKDSETQVAVKGNLIF